MFDNEKEEGSREINNKVQKQKPPLKNYKFILLLSLLLIFISIFILFLWVKTTGVKTCGDGSLYGTCAKIKPYYCDSGVLIEKASICGCEKNNEIKGESCISQYHTEPKEVKLKYILDGEEKELVFTVYKGLTDYLSNESRVISYQNNQTPSRADFETKILNNEPQKEFLLPLVIAIQNLTKNKVDQARIAISIVQNIEYNFSNKTFFFFGQEINYSRYPYEVLYEYQGICGEKSDLLAFLLRELGYGTVLFYNQKENHQAVGVKCPLEKSYKKTGYCFVETTGPAIISDDKIEYVGGIFLESEPQVIPISEGNSLPKGLPEYRDAEIMGSIRKNKPLLFKKFELNRIKKKYGLVEEYNLA